MNKKLYLEAPCAELIVVRFEGAFLNGTNGYNDSNHTQYITGGPDDDYEVL